MRDASEHLSLPLASGPVRADCPPDHVDGARRSRAERDPHRQAGRRRVLGALASKGFSTKPHDFIAEGDKVVVLTTVELDGETDESADVLTYNGDGRLVAFDTLSDETVPNRVFAKVGA